MTTMGRPPQHTHVAEQLLNRLRDGTYPPYERMPSTRALAEELGVAQATVLRAMRILQEDGLVWANSTGAYTMNMVNAAEDPPAREILAQFSIPQDVVDDVLAIHAQELAGRQLAQLAVEGYEMDCVCGGCTACKVSDYIALIYSGGTA